MSGSGPSLTWANLSKDLVTSNLQINEAQATAYSPKTRVFALTSRVYGELFSSIIPPLIEQLEKSKQDNASSADKFSCPLETIVSTIDQRTQEIIEKMVGKKDGKAEKKKVIGNATDASDSPTAQVGRPPYTYGLDDGQRVACIKHAHDLAVEWFKNQSFDRAGKNGSEQVKMWETTAEDLNCLLGNPELFNFFFRKLNITCSEKPVEYGAQEKARFGIANDAELGNAIQMNGAEYALLQVGELQAKKTIFYNPGTLPLDQLPDMLASWNYTTADYPKDRDLVMYINKSGQVTHLGVYVDKLGKVNSKFSPRHPYSNMHALFDVPRLFGTKVVFWRRPVQWKFTPIQTSEL